MTIGPSEEKLLSSEATSDTLPVVARGTRAQIIESCIKSSHLWSIFTHLPLATNMRSAGQHQPNNWLLSIGSGTLPQVIGLPFDCIEIPQQMIVKQNLIEAIYSLNLSNLNIQYLAQRVILAPTNKRTLQMNRTIIDQLPGDPHVYYISDSILS